MDDSYYKTNSEQMNALLNAKLESLHIDDYPMTYDSFVDLMNQCDGFIELYCFTVQAALELDKAHRGIFIKALEFHCSTRYVWSAFQSLTIMVNAIVCNFTEKPKGYRSEEDMKNTIVTNFQSVFPNFQYIGKEKECKNVENKTFGRIDILAKFNDRDVIIELKKNAKNPNRQLLDYAKSFKNPILIAITEKPLDEDMKHPNITYLIFDEIINHGYII